MPSPLILASASPIRAALLANAGLAVASLPARIDEAAMRDALAAEGARPRDLADTLAELKARKISEKHPEALVIGADQVLALERRVFAKPESPEDALSQLARLSGRTHRLLSAAVVCRAGAPVWRHVGEARLTMHPLSDSYRRDYVARNWQSIRESVGCYKLEEEGVRLFSRIDGDHFTVLGLPMLPLLDWLAATGEIAR